MRKIKIKIEFLAVILCLMIGFGMRAIPAGAEVLMEGLNGIWFENVELVFDENGDEVVFEPGMEVEDVPEIEVGNHFVGIICVQNIRIGANANHWDQGTGEQLTGVFAVRVEAIVPGITWIDADGNQRTGARLTFGAPTLTTFTPTVGDTFSTGLTGNEMFALYHQVPNTTTLYEFNGTVADDVAKATDGPLWATFGHGAGANGVWGTDDDDGYAYSYTDELGQPAENFSGVSRYALNAIQNNTGWIFPGNLNDPDEGEIGGPGGVIASLVNDMYMNSEFTKNTFWVAESSPWVFQSNDPAYLGTTQEQPPGTCRMTGGQNRVIPVVGTDGLDTWSYEYEQLDGVGFVTTGGQIGAPSGGDPRGHWTHQLHDDPVVGSFTFHSGTSSAPEETEISTIECADPGWCVQARCAPFKQIFWDGIGNFHWKDFAANLPCADVADKKKPTLHYYRAMVGDFGENKRPTREDALDDENPDTCNWFDKLKAAGWPGPPGPYDASLAVSLDSVPDVGGFADKDGQICDKCPDYYQIQIHCDQDPASVIIYWFEGFIDGGNYQIHPETGEQCPAVLAPELSESTEKLPPGLDK